ncbi:hypothetical protein N9J80_04225 [Flavobacteriaceae bacterium]|nr:hypothetical protein [Flavobacteriaceae bacterium]
MKKKIDIILPSLAIGGAEKVTVTAGSTIGANSVVGANAVVCGKLDANALYVGIPAKKIKSF